MAPPPMSCASSPCCPEEVDCFVHVGGLEQVKRTHGSLRHLPGNGRKYSWAAAAENDAQRKFGPDAHRQTGARSSRR